MSERPTPAQEPPADRDDLRVLGEILEEHTDAILERWLERSAAEHPRFEDHQREEILNALDQMIREFGLRLRQEHPGSTVETAREHGQQRSLIGWAFPDLIRDYEILHDVIHQHLTETLGDRYTPRQAKAVGGEMLEAAGAAAEVYVGLARKRLESKIRELTLELTEAEYNQRQETATTLHDNLQQVIVAARMRLDPIAEEVQKAHDYLSEAIEVTRNLASDLHPVVLDEEGVVAGFRWLGEAFRERYGLEVTVDVETADRLAQEETGLQRLAFEVVREALFNVVKHAETDRAWLSVRPEEAVWRIEVEDRGSGMDPAERASPGGRGMRILRHRVEQVGGRVELDAEPGQGTRVRVEIPRKTSESPS